MNKYEKSFYRIDRMILFERDERRLQSYADSFYKYDSHVILELIKKATSRKPNKNTDWYECPYCFSDLFPLKINVDELQSIEMIGYDFKFNHMKYCPYCGQRLEHEDG